MVPELRTTVLNLVELVKALKNLVARFTDVDVLSELLILSKQQNDFKVKDWFYLMLVWLFLWCNLTGNTFSDIFFTGNLRNMGASSCLHLHTNWNGGVTLVFALEAGLTACGANGCWLLSLAACSCSLAKRCFSSRVKDICRGWRDSERQGQWCGEPIMQQCVPQNGFRKWGV